MLGCPDVLGPCLPLPAGLPEESAHLTEPGCVRTVRGSVAGALIFLLSNLTHIFPSFSLVQVKGSLGLAPKVNCFDYNVPEEWINTFLNLTLS